MVAQNTSAQANQASTRAPVTSTQPQVAANGNPGEPIVQKPRREIDEAFRQLTDYHGDLPPKHELLFSFYISHLEHHRSQVAPVLHTQEQIADAFRQIAGVDRNPNMPYTGAIPPPAREGRLLTRFWQAHLEHHTRIAAAAAAAEEAPKSGDSDDDHSDDDHSDDDEAGNVSTGAVVGGALLGLATGIAGSAAFLKGAPEQAKVVLAFLGHSSAEESQKGPQSAANTGLQTQLTEENTKVKSLEKEVSDLKQKQVGTAQNQNEGANAAQNQELVQKNEEVTKLNKEVSNLKQEVTTLKSDPTKNNSADIDAFLMKVETLVEPFLTKETQAFMAIPFFSYYLMKHGSYPNKPLPENIRSFIKDLGENERSALDWKPEDEWDTGHLSASGVTKLKAFQTYHQAGFEMAEALKQKVDELKKK